MELKKINRRTFLKNSMFGAVGAGVGVWRAPYLEAGTGSLITRALPQDGQYKVGILGCGNRSKTHISVLNKVSDIEVAALCDLVPHKMKRRAELIDEGPPPKMYTDMEKMVQQENLDAVAVVLPSYLHKLGAITALEAGNHVLCEKPMALTVADCNDMIATAGRTRKALQIGTQLRHSSNFKMVAKTVQESPIGKVLQSDVNSYRGDWRVPADDEYPPGVDYWRMDQQKSGGVAYEMGAHIIDVNNWIFDSDPVAVASMQSVNNLLLRSRNSTDHAGIMVRYSSGALMNYGGNLYNYGPTSSNYLFADNGTVEFDGSEMSIHYGQPKGVSVQGELPDPETTSLPGGDGNLRQWEHFARVLAGEEKPYPNGIEGRKTVQICQGAVLSAREKQTIEVSELNDSDAPFNG